MGGGWFGCCAGAWRSAAASLTARCEVSVHASLQVVDGDDLVPRPDTDDEGAGSSVQDSVGPP